MSDWLSYSLIFLVLLIGGAKITFLILHYRLRLKVWRVYQPERGAVRDAGKVTE